MKTSSSVYATLLLLLASNLAYAGYDNKCLNDCFKSRHECSYCAYACRVDDATVIRTEEPEQPKCPLEGFTY